MRKLDLFVIAVIVAIALLPILQFTDLPLDKFLGRSSLHVVGVASFSALVLFCAWQAQALLVFCSIVGAVCGDVRSLRLAMRTASKAGTAGATTAGMASSSANLFADRDPNEPGKKDSDVPTTSGW